MALQCQLYTKDSVDNLAHPLFTVGAVQARIIKYIQRLFAAPKHQAIQDQAICYGQDLRRVTALTQRRLAAKAQSNLGCGNLNRFLAKNHLCVFEALRPCVEIVFPA